MQAEINGLWHDKCFKSQNHSKTVLSFLGLLPFEVDKYVSWNSHWLRKSQHLFLTQIHWLKVITATKDHVGCQTQPSACNAVKYVMAKVTLVKCQKTKVAEQII